PSICEASSGAKLHRLGGCPLRGWSVISLKKLMLSLMATEHSETFYRAVQGIKDAVKHQTPKNIEAILYTVEDHDTENKKIKEEAQENKMASIDLFQDGVYGMSNKNLEDVLELLRCLKALT
ncbi:MAG TPA: hypothetical protein VJG49_00785, partial [Candidatus Nanoarchaeia archaeon]|nr:hypothetical protein [Candidatus Nanoarchaeia archaeon]